MANPDGTPIWFELVDSDGAQAREFYAAVAGWTIAASTTAEQGDYRIAGAADGDSVAGLMTSPPGAGTSGWAIYFAAADVDALAQRVVALGGAVRFGPMDIPRIGRFAMVTDPQGVAFRIMTGTGFDASRAFVQAQPGSDASIGHGVWIELATPDPDAAFAFYGALFGWTREGAMPMGDMGDYAFIGAGDARPGAVMPSNTTGSTTGGTAAWSWYVHVADIDAALAAATAAGGRTLQPPQQIPGGGYAAKLVDSQGSVIGLSGPRKQGN